MKRSDRENRFLPFMIFTGAAVCFAAALSIASGSSHIPLTVVKEALLAADPDNIQHHIIWELRIPRTLGDIAVGAALSAAGAIMQGMSRNPLADSGLLGINGGAVFALAVYFSFFTALHYSLILVFSIVGAGLATAVVYGVTGWKRGNQSPVRLVIAGSAVNIFLTSLSQAVAMHFNVGQEVTFWTAGGVAGIRMEQLAVLLPALALGLTMAVCLAPQVALLNMGAEAATGLGLNVGRSRLQCMVCVLILAGGAVSLAGPVSFVGLVIPHLAGSFAGGDYRRIIPASILLGSLFMLVADLLSRLLNPPHETPVGLMFAVLGVPFFLCIMRRKGRLARG